MSEPTNIRAGDSITWTRSIDGVTPADGWALFYRLIHGASSVIDITATVSGDGWAVALTPAATATLTAGRATLVPWIERYTEVITLDTIAVIIAQNLRTATSFDGRGAAQKALDDARLALRSYLADGKGHVERYQIGDRTMQFRSVRDITDLIAMLQADVAREKSILAMLDGSPPSGRVNVRF